VLEQQWRHDGRTRLYTSGIRYSREGARVTRVTDDRGRPLDSDRLYTVAANELISTGSRFSVLRDRGKEKRRVGTDVQALANYLQSDPGALR
jgi:hypothetical protein